MRCKTHPKWKSFFCDVINRYTLTDFTFRRDWKQGPGFTIRDKNKKKIAERHYSTEISSRQLVPSVEMVMITSSRDRYRVMTVDRVILQDLLKVRPSVRSHSWKFTQTNNKKASSTLWRKHISTVWSIGGALCEIRREFDSRIENMATWIGVDVVQLVSLSSSLSQECRRH